MDTNKYLCYCAVLIVITIGITSLINVYYLKKIIESSPVEEMYTCNHCCNCTNNGCEEVIDFDDVTVQHDSIGKVLMSN